MEVCPKTHLMNTLVKLLLDTSQLQDLVQSLKCAELANLGKGKQTYMDLSQNKSILSATVTMVKYLGKG